MVRTKLLIFHETCIYRQGLARYFKDCHSQKIDLVGAAWSEESCFQLTQEWKPNVIIFDLSIPNSGRIILDLKRLLPVIGIVALIAAESAYKKKPEFASLIEKFAWQDITEDKLAELVIDVATKIQSSSNDNLTETEEKIRDLVRRGMSNKQIAFKLSRSKSTVKTHISNMMTKVGVHNRTQL